VQLTAESWSPQQVLAWAFETFGNEVAISSAFGAEGMVLIDMASCVRKDFRVFTIDTEFLFSETHSLIDRIQQKYEINIERVFSLLSPEEQERVHGAALWARDADQCCNLRKVEPLRRKLRELDAWITSIRRDQTSFRKGAGKVEWDVKFGLVKVNPIADWTSKQVWRYLHEHDVPYNSLHIRTIPASVARIARGPSGRGKIRGRAAGLALPKPSADCTSLSRCGHCRKQMHKERCRLNQSGELSL
jgi:phosphoadenosine phosphosulfate reductase